MGGFGPKTMRLSRSQGEAKAIRLAEAYLAARHMKGWTFKCLPGEPDYIFSSPSDRKVPTKWSVVVECSKDGATLDGPIILVVDIAKEEVMSFEQATQQVQQRSEPSKPFNPIAREHARSGLTALGR